MLLLMYLIIYDITIWPECMFTLNNLKSTNTDITFESKKEFFFFLHMCVIIYDIIGVCVTL